MLQNAWQGTSASNCKQEEQIPKKGHTTLQTETQETKENTRQKHFRQNER